MTRAEIEGLSGRELDGKVAERVMGHEACLIEGQAWQPDDVIGMFILVPEYCTNIAAAWLVVERMQERWLETDGCADWYWSFSGIPDGRWWVEIYDAALDDGVLAEHGDSLPVAICRAALLALEASDGAAD